MNRLNTDLHQLSTQRPQKPAHSSLHRSPAGKNYIRIREYTKNLYEVFRERFRASCLCRAHVANLPLGITTLEKVRQRQLNDLRLKVLFHFDLEEGSNSTQWNILEFEPVKPLEHALEDEGQNGGGPSTEDNGQDTLRLCTREAESPIRSTCLRIKETVKNRISIITYSRRCNFLNVRFAILYK
jgi:hypothetical protein